jgi:hypothetical protein
MDPLLAINKVFSMVVQEEHKKEITSTFFASLNHTPAVMATKYIPPSSSRYQGSRTQYPCKEHPLCTHCGLLGHTVEKCYKLHRYPLGYKSTKGKYVPSAN